MKICLACSHGGHLAELERLLPAFEGMDYFWLTYRNPTTKGLKNAYLREIIKTNPWKMLKAFYGVWKIFRKEKPDVVITTGAEIAIPAFIIAKLLGVHTINIVTVSHIYSPSETTRIIYPFTDVLLSQWKELLPKLGKKARYEGGLI